MPAREGRHRTTLNGQRRRPGCLGADVRVHRSSRTVRRHPQTRFTLAHGHPVAATRSGITRWLVFKRRHYHSAMFYPTDAPATDVVYANYLRTCAMCGIEPAAKARLVRVFA